MRGKRCLGTRVQDGTAFAIRLVVSYRDRRKYSARIVRATAKKGALAFSAGALVNQP